VPYGHFKFYLRPNPRLICTSVDICRDYGTTAKKSLLFVYVFVSWLGSAFIIAIFRERVAIGMLPVNLWLKN
jgi:hypothetical protein